MPTKRQITYSALLFIILATGLWACNSPGSAEPSPDDTAAAKTSATKQARYETTIKASRELGTLKTRVGEEEYAGVMCSTCHTIPNQEPPAERPVELDEFHTGMEFTHGALTCNSCHNPDDRNTLRAANGEEIAFADTMELCGQCHGPQTRDYRNGVHGGMNGYWDLDQGPRVRNNCVNCHDPHDPAFPTMMPAPPPRDRFFGDSHPTDSNQKKTDPSQTGKH